MVTDNNRDLQPVLLRAESEKDSHWDVRKKSSKNLSKILENGNFMQQNRSERTTICAQTLLFGLQEDKETHAHVHKLKHTWFCKARLCPICQQRKSLVWRTRAKTGCAKMMNENEKLMFVHLVLTVKNCHVEELNSTLNAFSEAFHRMMMRLKKHGFIVGYMRGMEVTREMNYCENCKGDAKKRRTCTHSHEHTYNSNCHPHGHILLAVLPSYFSTKYITADEWRQIWRESLQVDYTPQLHITKIKASKKGDTVLQSVEAAVAEVAKYCVKIDDEFLDSVTKDAAGHRFFLTLDEQLKGTKAIGLGGIFRKYLKDSDPTETEMIVTNEENEKELNRVVLQYREYCYNNPNAAYVLNHVLTKEEADDFEKCSKKHTEIEE